MIRATNAKKSPYVYSLPTPKSNSRIQEIVNGISLRTLGFAHVIKAFPDRGITYLMTLMIPTKNLIADLG
jgi:hypothetical protein